MPTLPDGLLELVDHRPDAGYFVGLEPISVKGRMEEALGLCLVDNAASRHDGGYEFGQLETLT